MDERGWDILDCPFFFTKYQVRAFFRSKVPAVGGLLSFFLDACVCVYIFFIYKLFFDVFLHVTFIFFVLSKTRQTKKSGCMYLYIYMWLYMYIFILTLSLEGATRSISIKKNNVFMYNYNTRRYSEFRVYQ